MRVPLKPAYGPTLGVLLAPAWRRAALLWRAAALFAAVAALLGAALGVRRLLGSRYRHGAPVPFGFSYRGLSRVAPDPGDYVKVARDLGGRLRDSYSVAPLRLGPYRGSVTGVLPLVAGRWAEALARRYEGFRLEGEGKTRINARLEGYEVSYAALLGGRRVYGRDVLLVPSRRMPRAGVVVEMLSARPASASRPVGSDGVLERPLKTFGFD